MKLTDIIYNAEPADQKAAEECQQRLDHIAKPLGSLGKLESMLCRIGGAQHTSDIRTSRKCVIVFCADNGVIAQGVAQSDHTVTTNIARSLAAGHSSVCVMASSCGADTFPVDVGMIDDVPEIETAKTSHGTEDFTLGPAMTRSQAEAAIMTGIRIVTDKARLGYDIIATGEAGIGNTTSSSAAASVLLGIEPSAVTGRGSGLSDDGLKRKISAIKRGIEVNKPLSDDPIDVISKVGGFDIAAMCGAFIGGACARVPVVIDGLISSIAALCAYRICPASLGYMLPSHTSAEPAGQYIMRELGFDPILNAGMRLGEGTGAVTLFPVIDMAAAVYNNAAVFEDINVEQYKRLS